MFSRGFNLAQSAAQATSPPLEKQAQKPSLVIIGGALRYDNAEVLNKIIELAGGKGAKIVVFPTASGNPQKNGGYAVEAFKKYGADPIFMPVALRRIDVDYKVAVRDPALINQVKSATGVYFIGGDQARITQALYTEDGKNTPMLDAIWEVYRKGGVIAGSSAGAAIMSTTMFKDAMDVLDVLKFGVPEGKVIDKGLGFIGPEVFVDQHFFTRGRFARALVAMRQKGYKLGLGVDENTAVVVTDRTQAEVIGYKGALLLDLSAATSNAAMREFNLKNAKLTYLDRGDQVNLKTKEVTPSPAKLADTKVEPNNPEYKPYFETDAYYPDILANTELVDLMSNFIDNKQKEVTGLAFTKAPDSKNNELGFEFKFTKGADSLGYFTGALGGEDYTVLNIYAEVNPIRVTDKLYEPRR